MVMPISESANKRAAARRLRGRRVPIAELREKDLDYHRKRWSVNATMWLHRNIFRVLEGPLGVKWVYELEDPGIIPKAEAAIPSRNLLTRRAWLSGLRGILKRALGWGMMRSVPPFPDYVVVASAALPRGTRPPIPSRRAVERLLDQLAQDETWEGRRIHALVAIVALAGLGLRQSLRLEVADFDLKGGTIRIRGGRARRGPRGSRPGRIRIDRRLRPILAVWLPRTGCRWAFPGKQRIGPWRERGPGNRQGPFSPDDYLQGAARVARVKVSFDGLRRFHEETAVSSLPDADAPATRPIPTTSPGRRLPRVRPSRPGEPSYIDGKPTRDMDQLELRVIDALLDAGTDGLGFEEMNLRCGRGGWRRAFDRLRKDPEWGPLLAPAGKAWNRYRILAVRDA